MMRAGFAVLGILASALAPDIAEAQSPGPVPSGPVPSVYIQEAVLSTVLRGQPNQRGARSCTFTALLRQYCGTAMSCDVASRPAGTQLAFFVSRMADIAQICSLPLSQAAELRVTYRCRYGDRFDGTIIEEVRAIALEDSGDPMGRAAFRILMACH